MKDFFLKSFALWLAAVLYVIISYPESYIISITRLLRLAAEGFRFVFFVVKIQQTALLHRVDAVQACRFIARRGLRCPQTLDANFLVNLFNRGCVGESSLGEKPVQKRRVQVKGFGILDGLRRGTEKCLLLCGQREGAGIQGWGFGGEVSRQRRYRCF